MRIIVSGNDSVALAVCEDLMHAHEVVLMGGGDWSRTRLDRMDIEVVEGPPTEGAVLERAGVAHCRVFIACTVNDETNIVSCLSARALGARRTICVLNQPGFVDAKGDDKVLASILGVDLVIRPWELLAQEILRIITIPGALAVELLASQRVALLQHAIEEGSPITRYPIKHYPLPDDVALVGLSRNSVRSIPNGNTQLQPGDKLTIMGTAPGVRALLQKHLLPPKQRSPHRATIIGGGVVGMLVAQGLLDEGWKVKLIELSRARCEQIAPRLPGCLVLHGDGSDVALLEEEQVSAAPVLMAVTNNDEKNLLISMLARDLGVERIITRAGKLSNEKLFERLGVDVVRSARGAAVRSIVLESLDPRHEIQAELEHGEIHVLELELPASFPPTALEEIHTNLMAIVGAVVRGQEVIIARGSTIIQPGDHLFIFCSQEDEEESRALFLNPPR